MHMYDIVSYMSGVVRDAGAFSHEHELLTAIRRRWMGPLQVASVGLLFVSHSSVEGWPWATRQATVLNVLRKCAPLFPLLQGPTMNMPSA